MMPKTLCALLLLFAASWPAAGDDRATLTAMRLTARAELPDPNFHDAIVLVMNNVGPGPEGVIINRPTALTVPQVFPGEGGLEHVTDKVYFGGPVEVNSISFLFRAHAAPEGAVRVLDGLYLSKSAKLLRQLLARDKPMDGLRIFIGHSGWAPGQLQAEIARGDWTLGPASADDIFEGRVEHRWPGRPVPDNLQPS